MNIFKYVQIVFLIETVCNTIFQLPSTPISLRLSPCETRLAITTNDGCILAVQVDTGGNLDELVGSFIIIVIIELLELLSNFCIFLLFQVIIKTPQNKRVIDAQWSCK